jgi:2-polyprenyl-6-methoxyphenol hydroxylase-like FAD-dependent oxidoreductase
MCRQGANLGFGDVRELAEQVEAMIRDGAGLGHR